MSRLPVIEPEAAPAFIKRTFNKVKDSLGYLPNLYKCLANSPEAMNGFIDLSKSNNAGTLDAITHKMITLAVSEINGCEYCTAMHTGIAVGQGLLTEEQCISVRKLEGWDEKTKAILNFSKELIEKRGNVDDIIIENLKGLGFDDAQIIEMVAVAIQICFANYVSNICEPELDYPPAPEI